jgi:uncharacterized cupin superfamily protein
VSRGAEKLEGAAGRSGGGPVRSGGGGPIRSGGGGLRVISHPLEAGPLLDWGPIPPPAGAAPPVSHTRGVLLHKGEGGSPEAGIWECTPGIWECHVTRDEFCHFLAGRCAYTHDSGERTEIRGGDAAFFPAGWRGRCEVRETVRKVYMIR